MRAPRELVAAASGVPAVAVTAAEHGFPLELITNWFLIIQPLDRAAAKVLGRRVTSAGGYCFVRSQIVAPDHRERTPEAFRSREPE